jgi:hypothetical protein
VPFAEPTRPALSQVAALGAELFLRLASGNPVPIGEFPVPLDSLIAPSSALSISEGEIFHNRQRRHSALGMLTSLEYELRHNKIEPVA